MKTHVVTKALPSGDRLLAVGTEVDASEWRNAPLLVSQRYLKPIDAIAESDGEQSEATFDDRVIAAIKKNLNENGELADLLTQRRGNKVLTEKSQSKSSNQS